MHRLLGDTQSQECVNVIEPIRNILAPAMQMLLDLSLLHIQIQEEALPITYRPIQKHPVINQSYGAGYRK